MILDPKEYADIASLTMNKNYNLNFVPFVKILQFTRIPFLKNNGFFMATVQSRMLNSLRDFQIVLSETKKELKNNPTTEQKEKLERKILLHTQWIRVIQTIADGIAWRKFNFNRAILRRLSLNDSSGHLEKDGYDYVSVLRDMLIQAPRYSFRIVNDLTRVLAIADLTIFYSDKRIILYELKEKGKKIIDAGKILSDVQKHKIFPKPQNLRHLEAQMSIINGKFEIPIIKDGKVIGKEDVKIVDLDFPIKHHYTLLKELIRKTEDEMIVNGLAEEGYYITATAIYKFDEHSLEKLRKSKGSDPDWTKSSNENLITMSSYDSFLNIGKDFPRNFLPYSVLHISAKDCIRIMMGHIEINVYVDKSILKKKLIERGWEVKDEDPFSEENNGQPEEAKLFSISRQDGDNKFNSSVLMADVLAMVTSFYSFDFILDGAYSLFEFSKKRKTTEFLDRNFTGENNILK